MGYQNVVVGSDGSDTAQLAVRDAAALAASDGARLVIVTAYEPVASPGAGRQGVPPDISWTVSDVNQAEERIKQGKKVATSAGVGTVMTIANAGSPADVVLDAARTYDADLIVVGSRGLTRGAHAIVGSVAATVAHHAPCDVMIVRTAP